ncbi:MAG: hypothetical protein KY461_09990 [Actinobacteria bacterium]|nr:hypothetical protein [Actinomycetota bacterium]
MIGRRVGPAREDGFVAAEYAAGVGLLLLPVTVLVLSLPVWFETLEAARVAAQQAARAVVTAADDASGVVAAERIAAETLANRGVTQVGGLDVRGTLRHPPAGDPQELVTVAVTVRVPAVQLPLIGTWAALDRTVSHTQPVDRYRTIEVAP